MPYDIKQWLEELELGKYIDVFADNEVGMRDLPNLTEGDLKDLGLPLGPRRRLLTAAALLTDKAAESVPSDVTAAAKGEAATSQAERRQLTVMFCDLGGSTALSTRLDPEDYREVIRAYQDACADVVKAHGGYVAKFMGDGVLAYFGWPQAHEDDARQAISAGLGIVRAVADIAPPNGEEPLAVRIGIATGPVVVGDIVGEGSAQEAAVTGETPNLAARLQQIAGQNGVVVAAATHALAGGLFAYEALGGRTLNGIEGVTEVWRVTGERRLESRFAAAHGSELTPLIGREEELEILTRRWERAKGDDGQVVLLSGEAGIGKSRLTLALRDNIGNAPHMRLLYQCSPHHTSSALYPIISQLEHAARIEASDEAGTKLDKLEGLLNQAGVPTEDVMPLFASLLSIPGGERCPMPDLTPPQQKDRTLAALVDQLAGLAAQQPVLFVMEDAHWIDPTTLELMGLITQTITDLPVLIIITYRPEFAAPWVGLPDVTTLNLSRLNARACTAMAKQLAGGVGLPAEIMAQLVEKTDGVPLFVEELTRSVLDARSASRPTKAAAQDEQDIEIVIPATLQEALEARLDRSPAMREVAQVGAAIGREFAHDLLARTASLSLAELDTALNDLSQSGLIFARGAGADASYTFKHALVQDTAYDSMMRSKRRETHKRIAEMLQELRPEMAEAEPAVLARHYAEAGMLDDAIDWLTRAGQTAAAQSANPEAVELIERGLKLVETLPASEARDRRELALQTLLFGPLISVRGQFSAELEVAFTRTLELCERVDEPEEMFRALFAKSLYHAMRGQHSLYDEVANDLLQRAKGATDEAALLIGHRMVAMSSLLLGRFAEAQKHVDIVLSTFDRARHGNVMVTYGQDPAVIAEAYNAFCQWVLGWPDRACTASERAMAEALELDHVGTLGPVLSWGGTFALSLSRDTQALRQTCKQFRDLTSQHKMPIWESVERVSHAVMGSMDNPSAETAAELHQVLVDHQSLTRGPALMLPNWWGEFLSENYLAIGDFASALDANKRGFALAEESGELWGNSELLRVRGVALAMRDGVDGNDEAETYMRRAIDDARSRSAKSLELRAAMSLARFLRDQGRIAEARETLAPIYGWFTEGFGTPDLIDAKALLDELA